MLSKQWGVVAISALLLSAVFWDLGVEGVSSSNVGGSWVVKKEERRPLSESEYGEISGTDISCDGEGGVIGEGRYHLQFITLEPNSLFLPVLLHADMVLYVHTGSGRLNWADERDRRMVDLRRGDIYKLPPGIIFFIQNNLEPEREKLRVHAIFTGTPEEVFEPYMGAYSRISDLLRGFDSKVLQAAFKVPKEAVEEISKRMPPAIVHATPSGKETSFWGLEARLLKTFLSDNGYVAAGTSNDKKIRKAKAFNLFDRKHDFENCNGWSLTVTGRHSRELKHSNIGVFMVNLTKGSMMGPHWNPRATEIAIVLQGAGMIRVVCSSTALQSECNNTRFRVREGDVFAVPRFHPMAQMSFNNESLVFVGFSTSAERNYPQFLAGKRSVLQVLDRDILAASFNVTNTTIGQLFGWQADSVILECTSCAEEEERLMEEEIEKQRREEEEEEEARREEKERKRKEEEEARRKEEEERVREERERQEEEERKKVEEEARRREEEERERKERQREREKKNREEKRRKRK